MPECPKCGAPYARGGQFCGSCGVVFAKVRPTAAPPEPAPPHPDAGRYEYKMVQIAPRVVVARERMMGNEMAVYLEEIVNKAAAEGWEFIRIDTMSATMTTPGIFGTRGSEDLGSLYVATFRRTRVK